MASRRMSPRDRLHLRRPAAEVRAGCRRRDRLRPLDVRRAPGARGDRPGRRGDRAPAAGRRADRGGRHRGRACSTAPTSSRPTPASIEAVDFARDEGPWDAFVAVGGGSAIDTAKAVNLLTTNKGDLLDYVNAPVGKGRNPEHALSPLVAVPTTTGTGSESTTVCVLDVLDQHVKSGISHPRLRPTLAIVDPRLTMSQPAGVTAACGMDILCHALECWTARPVHVLRPQERRGAGAVLRRQPDRATCGRRRRWAARRRRSARAVHHGDDEQAREQMALAATFAGMGFGNAGVHIPHANAYPIAGRVKDFRPDGLPRRRADGAARHGGVADRAGGLPVHVRGRARAARARGAAARRRDADRPADDSDFLPTVLADLMRDIAIPNGIAAVGYDAGDVDALVEGTLKQQRLLATAPREADADDLAGILHRSLELW